MYDKTQFDRLMNELSTTNQLLQPEGNVKRMVKFYTVGPQEAIETHMNNMIETYGETAVIGVIREKIENGDFCERAEEDASKVSSES